MKTTKDLAGLCTAALASVNVMRVDADKAVKPKHRDIYLDRLEHVAVNLEQVRCELRTR